MLIRPKSHLLRRCITGTSAIALATALATPARAQLSYNAPDPVVRSGNVTFSRGVTPGVETYNVNSATAVLDFTPNDAAIGGGPISFQNGGTTATYQSNSNFTVLNRIVAADQSRPIQFDGTVKSQIVNPATGLGTPGGAVWFFSPGGVILGPSASFDVGSLLISTGDPTGGTGTIGSTTSFTLNSAAGSNAAVTISPGATINVSPQGSYVALVAPVINQGGNVRVNGSAAYVAAEQATLSINQGLFDISVAVGSDGGGTPLTHNGSTGGPSSTGAGDNHGIYMVAVPKNTAITMLIAPTGQLGFDTAASASIENGVIYLQSGSGISTPATSGPLAARIPQLPVAPFDSNIKIMAGNVTSRLIAQAASDVTLLPDVNTRSLTLAQDALLFGGRTASLESFGNDTINAAGNLTFFSIGPTTPGTVQMTIAGGDTVTVAGALEAYTDRFAGRTLPANYPSDGGLSNIVIGGGTLNAGSVRVSADGSYLAGSPQASNKGGQAQIIVQSGGTLNVTNTLDISARGLSEGQATGGSAGIFVDGGTVKVGGTYSATADAVGAQVTAGSGNFTHQSKGGSAYVSIGANGSDVQVTGAISLSAKATGSTVDPLVGGVGGAANGGNSSIIAGPVSAGTSSIKAGSVSLISGATAGSAGATAQFATGGDAVGGTSAIALVTNSSLAVTGAMTVDSRAVGGNGGNGGGGGSATGGAVSTILQGGNISFGAGTLSLVTTGGRGSTGLAGTAAGAGGAALLGGGAGFNVTSSGVAMGTSLTIFNEAFGGNGGLIGPGTAPGAGGVAATTFVGVFIDTGGRLSLTQNLSGDTESFGGNAGGGTNAASQSGGASRSGSLTINVQNGSLTASRLSLDTESFGGDGFIGGNAIGGNLNIQTGAGGTITAANGYSLDTETFGGSGANIGGTGGQSLSGAISIASSGVMTLGGVTADTESFGGDGFTAGDGVSSNLSLSTSAAGSITISSGQISIDTESFGGRANTGGVGGKATSGSVSIFNLGTFDSSATSVSLDANAFGGDVNGDIGGVGGAALPGTVTINQSGGAMTFRSAVNLKATGTGGNGSGSVGGSGGAANAGAAQVFASAGTLTTGDLNLETRAIGGSAGTGDANTAGGNGGAALSGGGIDVNAGGGVLSIGSLLADASATGSAGGGGFNGAGIAGSGGSATSSRIGFGASNGGQIISTAAVSLSNTAGGGSTGAGIGQSGTTGGIATSGPIDVYANGAGKIQVLSMSLRTEADGGNGTATGSDGGDATGGTINFGPDNDSSIILTTTTGSAFSFTTSAFGGDNSGGGDKVAGFGKAGAVNMFADGTLQTGAGTSIFIDAEGSGGDYTASDPSGVGGAGFGGNTQLNVNRGDASFGSFAVDAGGSGGRALGAGTGGLGRGGHARLSTNAVFAGGGNGTNTLTFAGTVSLAAQGFGGASDTGAGGLGQGGTSALGGGIEIHALGGTITFQQSVDVEARGFGGSGNRGNGAGGNASIIAFGGKIDFRQSLFGSATAFGGDATEAGPTGVGGDATGGTVGVFTQPGGAGVPPGTPTSVSLTDVQLEADGLGGSGNGAGGGGTGGTAQVFAQGATIAVSDRIFVQSNGTGGGYFGSGAAAAGTGQGGLASVTAQQGGTLTIGTDVEGRATGTGGSASAANGGTAGEGRGGTAQFASFGPTGSSRNTITLAGNLRLDASGQGGSGGDQSTTGGKGIGGGAADQNGNAIGTGQGALLSGNFGDVRLGNSIELDASARGGSGSAAGGDAIGGTGAIDSVAGTVTIAATSATFIDVSGEGGDALNAAIGGRGGNGYAGTGAIHSRSGAATVNPSSTPSQITLGTVSIAVTGQGGAGGAGATGSTGGVGGDGFGGNASVYAEAGRGHLVLGDLSILAIGNGGGGGSGGAANTNGAGGAGGAGGVGTGGVAANTGTVSGPSTPENNGSSIFGNVTLNAFGFGGAGGNGVSGGVGGAGGAGAGGQANLLVRGSPVTAGDVNAIASAIGGNGGTGSTQGATGGATGGVAGLLVTNRFQRTERGTLTARNVSGSAFAFGDPTNTAVANHAGAIDVEFVNSDATFDSLSFAASGRDNPTIIPHSIIKFDNSNVTVRNTAEFSVIGDISVDVVNNAVFRTNGLSLDATGSLVPGTGGGTTPGLIDIPSDFSAVFGGDFVTQANLRASGNLSISAGGALQTGDLTANNSIALQSDTSIAVGKLTAVRNVSLESGGTIATGDILAGAGQPGTTFGAINLNAGGSITAGNLSASDHIVATAFGDLTAGKVVAGFGDPSIVTGAVEFSASGAITLGDINAVSVDIFTIDSMTLTLDKSFTAASGSPAFYIVADDFVLPADFTNAVLTITGLNIDDRGAAVLNGRVVDSAGIFAPGTGNLVLTQNGSNDVFNYPIASGPRNTVISSGFVPGLNSFKLVVNDTNNGIFGNLLSAVNISGGSISASLSFGRSSAAASAPIQTGAIAAERVTITGKADVSTGNLKAADLYPNISTHDDFLVGVAANGNIRTGSISSLEYVGLESVTGSVTTGAIDMGKSALLLAKTDVSTGAITGGTGLNNDVFVSNSSIVNSDPAFADLKLGTIFNNGGNFDPNVLSTATPVRLDDRFVASGAISTGGFAGAAAGGFQTGNITAPNRLLLDSGAGLSLGDLTTNGPLSLSATGALTAGNLTANTVNLKATQGVTTRAITSAGAVTVAAGTLASFGGVVSAPQITVSSADLQLDAAGAPGTLGTASTSQLTLNVTNTLPVTFGGSAAGSGYTITGTEAQGLRAQNVSLVTSDPITPIFMDSLNLSGTDIGGLTIKGGSITVNGGFTLANATASNRVTLNSSDAITVVTDRGGALALTGSSSNPGTLTLIGNTIVVGTRTVLSQLGATNRAELLAAPSGTTPVPEGFVRAGRLEFQALNLLAIQNSGSATQFAGFSAGTGGMLVSNLQATTPLAVLIFGRAADSSGAFKTNNDTLSLVSFGSPTTGATKNLTSESAVNTCLVSTGCVTASPPPGEGPLPPPQQIVIDRIPAAIADTVQGNLSSAADPEKVAALPTVTLITTIDSGQLRTEPVISDPVSGGGNPSLWESPENQDDRRSDRPAPSNGGDQ